MKRRSGNEPRVTLFDLIEAVSDYSDNEYEVVATVLHILQTGHARPLEDRPVEQPIRLENLAGFHRQSAGQLVGVVTLKDLMFLISLQLNLEQRDQLAAGRP